MSQPYLLDEAELATVLGALRLYQRKGMGEPSNRPDWLHEIVAPDSVLSSLDAAGIDELCERLNCGPDLATEAEIGKRVVGLRVREHPYVGGWASDDWTEDYGECEDGRILGAIELTVILADGSTSTVPCHVELIQVTPPDEETEEGADVQVAADNRFENTLDRVYEGVAADGPWQTMEIGGRPFVPIITPFCA